MDDFHANKNIEVTRRINNHFLNAEDAVIEEIFHDNRSSFITISYGVLGDFNMIHMTLVTLVVDRETIIRNMRGRRISVRDLKVGNVVDARFSAIMTRSIPPQSRAYVINVVRENVNPHPNPPFPNVVQGRIMKIDKNNNFVYTGNPNDMMSQIRFVVNRTTDIFDRRGNKIGLRELRPGQMIRVEHANFMTASIPPQTTAFKIWVL